MTWPSHHAISAMPRAKMTISSPDSHISFRKKSSAQKISWEPLLSGRAAKAKLRIGEIPGDEPPRIDGEGKLQILRWGGAYYFQFIREL